MYSILDIDLDYFNLMDDFIRRLHALLARAERSVDIFAEEHRRIPRRWKARIKRGTMVSPAQNLHADEHHDMTDEKPRPNIANVVYHAMRQWPACRVQWIVEKHGRERGDDGGLPFEVRAGNPAIFKERPSGFSCGINKNRLELTRQTALSKPRGEICLKIKHKKNIFFPAAV